jgi:outer membrane protein assembly factor BamB
VRGAALTAALLVMAPVVRADEAWPQWLGPSRDGRGPALRTGASPRLSVAWRRPLGVGTSALVAGGGRVFALFSDGETEVAASFALADGREAWRVKLDPGGERGPSSTPLLDEGRLVALSSACRLRALDAATGTVAWERDLKADFGIPAAQSCSTSPLRESDVLIVQAGGRDNATSVVALDPATGRTRWSLQGPHRVAQASPVAADIGGRRQLVVHGSAGGPPPRSALLGLDLASRSVLWSHPLENGFSFDTPVVAAGGRIVLATWQGTHAVSVVGGAAGWTVQPGWKNGDLSAYVSPPVALGRHLYGFGGDHLACVEVATGRTAWKERLYHGSVTAAGPGHLVVLSVGSGALRLVEARPDAYRELARVSVFNPGSRAEAPAILADGLVLARNDEELVAVRVE